MGDVQGYTDRNLLQTVPQGAANRQTFQARWKRVHHEGHLELFGELQMPQAHRQDAIHGLLEVRAKLQVRQGRRQNDGIRRKSY